MDYEKKFVVVSSPQYSSKQSRAGQRGIGDCQVDCSKIKGWKKYHETLIEIPVTIIWISLLRLHNSRLR